MNTKKMNDHPIKLLFDSTTLRFGLRGDPYLWKEMEEETLKETIPETVDEFMVLVHAVFEKLTQNGIPRSNMIYIERYSHGGMSQGMISLEWWNETGFPRLKENFKKVKQ